MSFKDYNFKEYINKALDELHFMNPTPVQEIVIPKVLKGEKVAVQSATGSGKTHAFLLPLFQKLNENQEEVQAVILSPTRELAMQLFKVVTQISDKSDKPIDVRLFIGGSDRESELKRLEKSQPMIAIGTLGRISDLAISSNALKIYTAKTFVIDEADMVFDQDELVDVDKVIGVIQGRPQFLIFSATIHKGLRHFLMKYLQGINVIALEEENLTQKNIEHIMIPCKAKAKEDVLLQLLGIINPYLALIFVNTREKVDDLSEFLAEHGYKVGKLHGDLEDRERKQVLKRINDLEFKYVVCSDIAARGIDIQGVSHVINFDLPKDVEFYIHRTGRTARYDQTGQALSLYDYDDDEYVNMLKNKGLKPKYMKISEGGLVETRLKPETKVVSARKQIENLVHSKVPVPKKVKPGYKKKRMKLITNEMKKAQKERISEIYRKKARASYHETREPRQ